MPKCSSCGRNYHDSTMIELVRNQDNRWISVCRECLTMGVDINLVKPASAVDDSALAVAEAPSIDVSLAQDPLENAKNLLGALRSLRQSQERVGRARSHERKPIEMTVYFTLPRDDTRNEAVVKDFSQGGVRVVTSLALTKGQTVRFDWNMPLPPTMARLLQSAAEVRRVIKNDDGRYEVGFKFITRTADKGANRRRFRRYKCAMPAYYQREGSEFVSAGVITDISQGGCQISMDEQLEHNETFKVRLIGGGGNKGDLVGGLKVCRVIPKDDSYEIGCAFDKMRVEQLLM